MVLPMANPVPGFVIIVRYPPRIQLTSNRAAPNGSATWVIAVCVVSVASATMAPPGVAETLMYDAPVTSIDPFATAGVNPVTLKEVPEKPLLVST